MKFKTELIAEVGICHRGDPAEAIRMMRVAAAAGVDTVKFQARIPRKSVPRSQWDVRKPTPFWADQGIEELSYIEYKEKLELPHEFYDEIDDLAKELEVQWSTSFWEVDTMLDFSKKYDLPWIKIPSAHCTNIQLVKKAAEIAKEKLIPLYVSTGMTTQEELDNTYRCIRSVLDGSVNEQLVFFHCHAAYPSPLEEINLRCITTLADKYGCKIGYSGHEREILTSCASICLGASVVEKHMTLNRNGGCTDDPFSLEPVGLNKWVRGCRDVERAISGDGNVNFYESEQFFKTKLRTG